jgi:hypothetical protein
MSEYIRPYKTETVVLPGHGVVQGEDELHVKVGAGRFLGVYGFMNARRERSIGDHIGVQFSGLAKVLVSEDVNPGEKGVCKADGTFTHVPELAGMYESAGIFLEAGLSGQYVDFFIERNLVIKE